MTERAKCESRTNSHHKSDGIDHIPISLLLQSDGFLKETFSRLGLDHERSRHCVLYTLSAAGSRVAA